MEAPRIWPMPTVKQPRKVAQLDAEATAIVLKLDEARGELRAAERVELPEAEAADLEEEADAYANGRTVKDPGSRARAVKAKIGALERKVEALTLAARQVALRRSEAVHASLSGWTDAALAEEAAAEEELRTLVRDVLRPAIARLTLTRGTLDFLARAAAMDSHAFARYGAGAVAPALTVRERLSDANSRPTAASIVDALEQLATKPEEKPQHTRPSAPRVPRSLPPMLGARTVTRAAGS
jgi:hypothetical protein